MASTAILVERTGGRASHGPLALWHLLSLDAPTVAAVWTCFLAVRFHVALHWSAPAALFVAVWMMYAADRIGDARHGAGPLEERHHFHSRHERAFRIALAFAAAALVLLLLSLPSELRAAWMLLGVPLLGYVAGVHVLRWRVPKEAMVGVFFALAVPMPVLLGHRTARAALAAAMFGLMCSLNCMFVARSEGVRSESLGAVTGWCVRHLRGVLCLFLVAAMAAAYLLPAVSCALLLCAIALLLLLQASPSEFFDGTRVRALADAALLTPLLLWPVMHFLR